MTQRAHSKRPPAKTKANAAKRRSSAPLPFDPLDPATRNPPDPKTKLGKVVSLVSRKGGASLQELVKATGWQPHTARAALTGLRKRGYPVLHARPKQGVGLYRLEPLPRKTPALRVGKRRKTVAVAPSAHLAESPSRRVAKSAATAGEGGARRHD